jgi:integrase
VRFLKGVFELRTPEPRYSETWDVSVLLTFLRSKGDNSFLSFKDLSRKLCALLLLVSVHRVQSVYLIKLEDITITETICRIVWKEKLKHTTPKKSNLGRILELSRYSDPLLCVVRCLEEYIKRTEKMRSQKTVGRLVLCCQKPFGAASKDTIARWLKELLIEAGINNYGAHSFRGASSSAMLRLGCPIDKILEAAGWSNASTFQRFYNRPVDKKTEKANANKTILDFFGSK